MRINHPDGYIKWLKSNPIYRNGELDNLPSDCIIIHDSLIVEHLTLLGYNLRNYNVFKIGATDPIEFFLVREHNTNFEFIIMNGLPGGGGISTQISEMSSLGCSNFIHIGTCGLFGNKIKEGTVIVSNGSLKDESARLLSSDDLEISKPDQAFKNEFEKYLKANQIDFKSGIGVTTPIFYHQPEKFIKPLLKSNKYDFIEMEQAPFFETCKIGNVKGISVVTGSDRYEIKADSINHQYYDLDQNKGKNDILRYCIDFLKQPK